MAFQSFALAAGWQPDLQIDRIDTDGNYEPGNVRFVTRSENNRNRRNNRVLTIAGQTRTATEWARMFELEPKRLFQRLARGWDPAIAVCLSADWLRG
jgi:hypothetical protein